MNPRWTLDNEGDIRFTLKSNGRSSKEWAKRIKTLHLNGISDTTYAILCSAGSPTNGVCNVVVRPGSKIAEKERYTRNIREAARKNGWTTPPWDVACLIRDNFSNDDLQEMTLPVIVTMHEPIIDMSGRESLLISARDGFDQHYFGIRDGKPNKTWDGYEGFAFLEQPKKV